MPIFEIMFEVYNPDTGLSQKNFRACEIVNKDKISEQRKKKTFKQEDFKMACEHIKKYMNDYNKGIRGNQWYENSKKK